MKSQCYSKHLGKLIKHYRRQKHLTVEQLAKRVELSTGTLNHYECGYKSPSLNALIRIANALEVGTDALLYDKLTIQKPVVLKGITKKLETLSPSQLEVVEDMIETLIKGINKLVRL